MPKNLFEVGDFADRKDRALDPRPVAEVKGDKIRLEIGHIPDCWVPAEWYDRIPAAKVEALVEAVDQTSPKES